MQNQLSVNILIVDDRPENLFAMAELLNDPSFRIITAESGRDALRLLLETEFAVILLDVQMPDMDGFETAACIRQREQSRHTPIIFVTAVEKDSASVEKGYAFGAVDYLFKPVVPMILKAKVAVFADLYRKQYLEKLTRKALRQSNMELEKFAYIASHDLQEPLRKVRSFAELLARQYKGRLDEKADEFIDYITDGAERMQRLINGLLEYSRLTTQADCLKPTDLNRLVADVVMGIDLIVSESRAVIRIGSLPRLHIDAGQMARVFQNLILNAMKFSGDSPPRITISATRTNTQNKPDGSWYFFVRDRGIGIDPDQCERIFDLFQRLHPRSEYPGEGMGLAICNKIIDRHGGRIWANSPGKGQGTTVCFTLPAASPPVFDPTGQVRINKGQVDHGDLL